VRSAKDMQEKMNKLVENLFDYGVTIEELPVVKAIFEDGLDYLEDLINEGMSSSNEMIWDNIK
jgi:DNA-binding protein YbaB